MSHRGKGPANQQRWKEKPRPAAAEFTCAVAGAAAVAEEVGRLSIAGDASPLSHKGGRSKNRRASDVWIVRGCTTASSSTAAPVEAAGAAEVETERSGGSCPRSPKIFNDPICAAFNVDNCTFSHAQIRATFYPKFENEKSDQEIRTKMIEMVSHGLATLEVSLKHSGSLFMYASHEGGAYAKNSFRNMYTAVGVFVLSRMFLEAWGTEARRMQAEFNNFLEKNRMCISMELVTACLGDHGQRPIDDYVVVTAVTELGHGKPKFYSTPELIAFCRKWRLPTNHVWLFSTRKSATSFFAAYDALCEEGTATPVCKALNEIADISVPGSKDHVKVQGEILEGLVVRVVSPDSSKEMEDVLRSFPPPPSDGVGLDLGPSLREVCSANRSDEKQLVKSLLQHAGTSMCPNQSDWFGDEGIGERSRQADRSVVSKFLQAHPADYATMKLQEMIRLMKQRRLSAAFKCYYNLCKIDSNSSDYIHYKMVIHIHKDYVFQRYRKEMRENPELWPLYRGFFIDINLFKVNEEEAAELTNSKFLPKFMNDNNDSASIINGGLADEDGNLMMKLKFLTYRLRTFLIRNGLRELFKDGPNNYKSYYLKQMNTWGTSAVKQEQLSKMLDEWAIYIQRKYENKRLPSLTYLSEAEPFLEHYANRTLENQALVGFAGNLIGTENILSLIHGSSDEEDDLPLEEAPRRPTTSIRKDPVSKAEGLIIFFPGIPGCAKSALCKEILGNDLADDRPMNIMMGDLIKGRYWQKVAEEHRRKPYSIILADKNAPNEEVWRQVENMCRSTRASAIPVIPESEGTDSNPFSLDALAVFMFRVLQRVNHPGNLDKASPNAGYVLLMFYRLYDGKTRRDFENELCERFGSLVRIPLLKQDRKLLPEPIKVTLEEGITLFRLHSNKHGSLESSKGAYAKDWAKWEKGLREVLFGYADHLNDIQVPFDFAAKIVLEQLKDAVNGEYKIPGTQNRKLGNIVFAAVTLHIVEIKSFLNELARKHNKIEIFLKGKDMGNNMRKAHVTLAHKRSHGVAAVASYGIFLKQNVPVHLIAFLFSKRMAAIEVKLGSVNNEKVEPKTEWPHVTLWTAPDVPPKEVGTLPSLVAEGRATRIEITPPVSMSGSLDFY